LHLQENFDDTYYSSDNSSTLEAYYSQSDMNYHISSQQWNYLSDEATNLWDTIYNESKDIILENDNPPDR
jgi:hypothetical protein